MKAIVSFYLVILFIFFAGQSFGQQYSGWKNYSYSGLVTSIAEKDNELWIGSTGGLWRYNKTTGEKTFYNKFNSGLPYIDIRNIQLDKNGNLWFAIRKVAVKFDGSEWHVYNSTNSPLPDAEIRTIAVDLDGNIWFGTGGGGAVMFDGANWVIYNTQNSGIPGDSINDISASSTGDIWFAFESYGLSKKNGDDWIIYDPGNCGIPANSILMIDTDEDNNVLVGTHAWGAALFNGSSWEVWNTSNSQLPSNYLLDIFFDSKGYKFFGSYAGLTIFDGTEWKNFNTGNSGIPGNAIFNIFQDHQNNIWLGVFRHGAVKFDESDWFLIPTATPIRTNCITSIGIDDFGTVWFGANGIVKYDGSTWEHFQSINCISQWDLTVGTNSIVCEEGEKMWFATEGIGYLLYTGINWLVFNMGTGYNAFYAEDLAIDKDKTKWIATINGLSQFHGGVINFFTQYNSPLLSSHLHAVSIDSSGNKWISMSNEGVCKFDGENWTFFRQSLTGLISNYITCIETDMEGKIWFGSSFGVSCFDGTNWRTYNKINSGLPDNKIKVISTDKEGNIWFGTFYSGVARFNGNEWTVYNTSNSGLHDDAIYDIAIDHNNNIWFATAYGGAACFEAGITSVETEDEHISRKEFLLLQNYPNPFNPVTKIKYSLGENLRTAGKSYDGRLKTTIKIYDILGTETATLVDEIKSPGTYEVEWNGEDHASGVYFCKLSVGNYVKTIKLLLLK